MATIQFTDAQLDATGASSATDDSSGDLLTLRSRVDLFGLCIVMDAKVIRDQIALGTGVGRVLVQWGDYQIAGVYLSTYAAKNKLHVGLYNVSGTQTVIDCYVGGEENYSANLVAGDLPADGTLVQLWVDYDASRSTGNKLSATLWSGGTQIAAAGDLPNGATDGTPGTSAGAGLFAVARGSDTSYRSSGTGAFSKVAIIFGTRSGSARGTTPTTADSDVWELWDFSEGSGTTTTGDKRGLVLSLSGVAAWSGDTATANRRGALTVYDRRRDPWPKSVKQSTWQRAGVAIDLGVYVEPPAVLNRRGSITTAERQRKPFQKQKKTNLWQSAKSLGTVGHYVAPAAPPAVGTGGFEPWYTLRRQ